MEVQGKLIEKFDTEQVSETFKKREFVLEVAENPSYPQQIIFQATQAKCDYLDKYELGDVLSVNYNLKGRRFNGQNGFKYFNTLEAWKFDKAGN